MFGRKKNSENSAVESAETVEETAAEQRPAGPTGKSGPTPKRKDQEAARKRPLVPDDRKAARAAQRQAVAEQRAKMRIAMETGDERHMPYRDRGPQKRFARDYVDARYGIGEWLMLIVLVFLVLSFIPIQALISATTILMLATVGLVVLEGFWVNRKLKSELERKFGVVEPGVRWYGTMRAMQLRRLRLPKPQVRRGQFPS